MIAPYIRATDVDRTKTCALLDSAYTDGQLDAGEHQARLSSAMAAKTLYELQTLVMDLQVTSLPVLPAAPKPAVTKRHIALGGAAVVLVGAWIALVGPGPTPFAIHGFAPIPVAVSTPHLCTASALDRLVANTRTKFGATTVTTVTITNCTSAEVKRYDGVGNQMYHYTGRYGSPTASWPGENTFPDVDLATLNTTKIAAIIATASDRLNVPNPTWRTVTVAATDDTIVTIDESNLHGAVGNLEVGLDGSFRAIHPAG